MDRARQRQRISAYKMSRRSDERKKAKDEQWRVKTKAKLLASYFILICIYY